MPLSPPLRPLVPVLCALLAGACGSSSGSSTAATTANETTSPGTATTAEPTAGPTDSSDAASETLTTTSDATSQTTAETTSDATSESTSNTTEASTGDTDTSSETDSDTDSGQLLYFSVIGDTPYEDEDTPALNTYVEQHNAVSPSQFLVHVGDIKRGAPPCVEAEYTDIKTILHGLDVPAFIIPGDNEWNDCADPDAAWALWMEHLYQLELHWNDLPDVERQPERVENFAFVDQGVLVIGINLVGGAIHDPDEWALRFEQNVTWIDQQFATHPDIFAAVVFAHALPDLGNHQEFVDGFKTVMADYLTPTLFLHGDGHFWVHEQGYMGLEHVTRVMVECCSAKPVQIGVDPLHPEVFVIEREPF